MANLCLSYAANMTAGARAVAGLRENDSDSVNCSYAVELTRQDNPAQLLLPLVRLPAASVNVNVENE